tara:strand:- start:837 stop:1103 length:267 start_codon:yes stop_codon:yes gene_type:complete
MRITYLGVSESSSFIASNSVQIPLYVESVSAGFSSPAQDFVERTLDLNELCIPHPMSTFFVRAQVQFSHLNSSWGRVANENYNDILRY